MKYKKKRTHKLTIPGQASVGLLILFVITLLVTTVIVYSSEEDQTIKKDMKEIKKHLKMQANELQMMRADLSAIHEHFSLEKLGTLDFIDVYTTEESILVTNYWPGDGTSGEVTASGLSIEDFDINDEGMYTYKDLIVVATANIERLPRPIYGGYTTHELYDELTLTFNNTTYGAVVLDVCGACYGMPNETNQRYDVFTIDNVIGKVEGIIHE